MHRLSIIPTLLLVIALPLFTYAQNSDTKILQVENGLSPNLINAIGENNVPQHILKRMQATKVQGLGIAVVDNGRIAWAKGYGLKDATSPDSVTVNTLFQCASIGKVITALAAMNLVEQGKIDLDQDINQKLKNWKLPENKFTQSKKVTLRMLLSHSAGLDDSYGFQGYYPGSKIPTLTEMLSARSPANNKKQLEVKTVPGTQERYSGGGYLIIQQLIEDISETTFADYVQKQIFDPLQMKHTTYSHYPDTELKMDIARGHEDNGNIDPKRKYNLYPEMAAAGPWTTPTDLAKLIVAIHQAGNGENKTLPGPELTAQMLTPQLNAMGLGLNLKGADKVLGYWHAGNNAGYTGMLFAITSTGQGAVVLTNSNAGEYLALEAVRSIANAYNWSVMKTINEQPLENINAYLGLYRVGEKEALVFTQQKNQLYFNKAGSRTNYRLYKAEDGSFRMIEKPDNLKFTFQRDGSGNITGATMYENSGSVNVMTKSGR